MKKLLALLLALSMVLALCACGGPKNPLIGEWKVPDSEVDVIVQFSDRTITFINDEIRNGFHTYEYEWLDNQHIKIYFDDSTTNIWSYQISGDSLTITYPDGRTGYLIRVK